MTINSTSNKIVATIRKCTGKYTSRKLRREGSVPAVLYGNNLSTKHLEINSRELVSVIRHYGKDAVLTLDIDGVKQSVTIKDLVIHPIKLSIQHIDLLTTYNVVKLLLILEGMPILGFKCLQQHKYIEVKTKNVLLDNSLIISINNLSVGNEILAGQIKLPLGTYLISDPKVPLIKLENKSNFDSRL